MLLLKATLVLVIATAAGAALRRAPGLIRHRLWSLSFAAMIALPALAALLPPVNVPVPDRLSWSNEPSRAVTAPETIVGESSSIADTSASSSPSVLASSDHALSPAQARWRVATMLSLAWATGTLIALTTVIVSILRLRRLAAAAIPVRDPAWCHAAAAIARRLGLRTHVRLLTSTAVSTPMAGGVLRPAIFLPARASSWDSERREVVLAHELAHVAARDPQRHLLARVAVSLYWFHPLAWFAARQATAAREEACDERVLALGARPSTYARVLVELAESMEAPPRTLAALPIVHRSLLEARVMAILNRSPHPLRARYGWLPVFGVTALTAIIAAAHPGAEPAARSTQWINASPVTVARVAPDRQTPQPIANSDSCFARSNSHSFAGRTSTNGREEIFERIGVLDNAHRLAFISIDGVRLCMFAESVGSEGENATPSRWVSAASRVILESASASSTHRMLFGRATPEPLWQVNGSTRPVDRSANEWRERMLAVLDAMWEKARLEGHRTSLQGEITSLQGHETSLQGEITSLQGEVTSMEGRITSIRGEETSMQGRITSIRGHETSLQGQITSAQSTITSINTGRYPAAEAHRRIADYERQIERIERELKEYNADAKAAVIEKEIRAFDADRKVAEIEKQIAAFDLDKKVADIERRIAALKVGDKVKDIEAEIRTLDVDRQVAAIEKRLAQAAAQLKTTIGAIR